MFLRLQLALLGLLLMNCLTGQNIKATYTFDSPVFIDCYDGYTEMQIKGCTNMGDEGYPLLPVFSGQVLIPQGKEVAGIKIVEIEYSNPVNGINIVPAARQFPVSIPAPHDYRPQPNTGVYETGRHYPAEIFSDVSTHFLGGFSIAVFNIRPVVFNAAEKWVKYIKSLEIEIETVDLQRRIIQPACQNETTLKRLQRLVSNPELASTYSFSTLRDNDQVDLLIITKSTFVDDFTGYAAYKAERGYITEIITTEFIYENYSGTDNQEKIRNCITDFYENRGIIYVILGGDSDTQNSSQRIIPHRGFYVDTGYGTVDDDIPSDMYYSGLDGNWNNNGNNRFGEPGEEDLFAEVIVGRFSIDSNTEVQNMMNKLIKYQDTPVVEDIEKALMIGEALDSSTWGGAYKDEVANGSSNHGYITAGVTPNFTVNRLYEMNGNWSKQQVFQQFNTIGVNLLNHLGHSSVDYNMKMDLGDLTTTNLQNDGIERGFVIGYSQGCYNGSFDNRNSSGWYMGNDCFAEKITTMETAMVASLSNSRYGWYSQGNTNGASQIFDRKFYDALFAKSIPEIGAANNESKEDAASFILSGRVVRWCAYEITLFGDPSMPIWTEQPVPIVAEHPQALPIGIENIFVETDAPGARIGISQNGNLLGRAITGENGSVTIEFFEMISSDEPLTISITAHNRALYTAEIPVLADQPYVIADYFEIDDSNGNNNGIPEPGEMLQLGLGMKNLGNQPATGVVVTLSSNDNYITLAYLAVEFGDIQPGETVFIENAFPVILAGNIPDQHQVIISVDAAMGCESWISTIKFYVNAPVMTFTGLDIDDSEGGNGNGLLDQGENVILSFEITNTGHADSPDLLLELSSNEHLVLETTQAGQSGLQPGEECILEFEATVDPDALMGDLAVIQAVINAGEYSVSKEYQLEIGMLIEDFESGDFSLINWQTDGEQPWTITSVNPFEGVYCAKSGAIDHNQTSELKVEIFVAANDTISFYKKVSSESGYDFLKFYDGLLLKGQFSGNNPWEKVSYVIYPGYHTLRWVYEKDGAITQDEDCAWLDYIRFPKLLQSNLNAGGDDMVCAGEPYQTKSSGIYLMGIQWETTGSGTFDNPAILQPVYTPSDEDIQNGSVVLSVSATSANNQTLSDQMTLLIVNDPATPAQPEGPTEVCTNYGVTYEYSTPLLPEVQAYVWQLIPEDAGIVYGDSNLVTILWTPDYIGNVELKVKAMNVCGESSFSESLLIEATICTSIHESSNPKINLYPNPADEVITLNLEGIADHVSLTFYNSFGQIISYKSSIKSENRMEIDLAGNPPGLYYVIIDAGKTRISEKFILK